MKFFIKRNVNYQRLVAHNTPRLAESLAPVSLARAGLVSSAGLAYRVIVMSGREENYTQRYNVTVVTVLVNKSDCWIGRPRLN